MKIAVILPAAGLGSRFAAAGRASASKIEFELAHKPVFLHAIELFHGHPDVIQVMLAVHPDRLDDFDFRWADKLAFMNVKLIAGGRAERWETVKLALGQVSAEATHIAVHDAARPCGDPRMIDRVFAAAASHDAVVPGLPMSDTVKQVGDAAASGSVDPLVAILGGASAPGAGSRPILQTIPRHDLMRVQTPQVFERGLIERAYAALNIDNAQGITDDASVVERLGETVQVIEGDPLNLKITHPADAELLEAVLASRREQDAKDAAVKQLFGDDDEDE